MQKKFTIHQLLEIFSYLCIVKVVNKMLKSMCNSLISKPLGGGGHSLRRTTINHRVVKYVEKKLKTDLDHIEPDDRQDIIAVLIEKFEYTPAELVSLFKRSRAQIYRDLDIARFRLKHPKSLEKTFTEILDYILYNAKYIP